MKKQTEEEKLRFEVIKIVNKASLIDDFGNVIPADGVPDLVVNPILSLLHRQKQELLEENEALKADIRQLCEDLGVMTRGVLKRTSTLGRISRSNIDQLKDEEK